MKTKRKATTAVGAAKTAPRRAKTAIAATSAVPVKVKNKIVALLRREAGSPASGHTVWSGQYVEIQNDAGIEIARARVDGESVKMVFLHSDLTPEEESIVTEDWLPWIKDEVQRKIAAEN